MILDTNVLSATADGEPAIVAVLGSAETVAIPVIVLGEFRYGIAQSRNRRMYEKWLDELLNDCPVLDVQGPKHPLLR
jgi:tRNA(fMet)-specific endonuclease VapC